MKNNIIMGNGINIQFDKSNNNWSKLGSISQKKFKDHIYNLNKNNPILNSIYKTFKLIEKYIQKEKFISLEGYVKFFNIFYYKEIMDDKEFKIFIFDLWKLLITLFNNKVINYKLIESSKISFDLIYTSTYFLFILENLYKRIFKNVIIDIYKIDQIKIDKKVIKYINNYYDVKITLNYDNNLKDITNLIYLHGKFDKKIIKWDGNLKEHQKNIINSLEKKINPKNMNEYSSWYEENVIQEDLILRNASILKNNELNLFSFIKKYGIKNLFFNLGIKNKNIDFNKFKIDKSSNYKKTLFSLKGKVTMIGINQNNDELILKMLNQNKNITKIIIYGEKDYKFSDRIEYKHFSKFWQIIEK